MKTSKMKLCIALFISGLVVVNGYPKQPLDLKSIDNSLLQDDIALQNEQETDEDYGIKYIGKTDGQMKPKLTLNEIGKALSDNFKRPRRILGLNSKRSVEM